MSQVSGPINDNAHNCSQSQHSQNKLPTRTKDKYLEVACKACGVSLELAQSRKQTRVIVLARHVAVGLMKLDGYSCLQIGKAIGRDHTTALSGLRRLVALTECNHNHEREIFNNARKILEES